MREPLIWLGEFDPCDTVTKVRNNDPHRDLLVAVVMQWKQHLNLDTKYTVQEVIGRALVISSFHNALLGVAGSRTGGSVSNANLGRWLKKVEGKIVGGYSLIQDGVLTRLSNLEAGPAVAVARYQSAAFPAAHQLVLD